MIYTKKTYTNAIISHDKKDVQDIHLEPKNIAIYQRDIDALKEELYQMTEQTIECRASGTVTEIVFNLQNYFTHNLSNCTALLEDITQLLRLFEATTQADSFRLLLATVSTNMCSKFHTDINHLRLLCTYIGPGTLFLMRKLTTKLYKKEEVIKK